MKELQQALSEIQSIRSQVARGTEFRGYGPASIAVSGVLALLVAAVQAEWTVKHRRIDLVMWIGVWAGTAAVSLLLTGVETFARAREPKELEIYPCGHFGLYPGRPFHEAAAERAAGWFGRWL